MTVRRIKIKDDLYGWWVDGQVYLDNNEVMTSAPSLENFETVRKAGYAYHKGKLRVIASDSNPPYALTRPHFGRGGTKAIRWDCLEMANFFGSPIVPAQQWVRTRGKYLISTRDRLQPRNSMTTSRIYWSCRMNQQGHVVLRSLGGGFTTVHAMSVEPICTKELEEALSESR